MPLPADCYILANGPTLDVDRLPELANAWTIGTNRILRSGFAPTMLFFNDPETLTYDLQDAEHIREYRGLVVSNKDHAHSVSEPEVSRIVWARAWRGEQMHEVPCIRKGHFYINGNGAVACAIFAIACGAKRVHMLGCGCGVPDENGPTHFYGDHPVLAERYRIPVDLPVVLRTPMLSLEKHYSEIVDRRDNFTTTAERSEQTDLREQLWTVLRENEARCDSNTRRWRGQSE